MGFLDTITNGVTEYAQKIKEKVTNTLDPSQARLGAAGLLPGGKKKQPATINRIGFAVDNGTGAVPIEEDWRIRVSVAENSGIFYKSNDLGILAPLKDTSGVIFPYTPSITTSFTASYSPQKSTHSNYSAFFYEASEVSAINVSGDFTVQTVEEGQYLLACIYFFRASTKMFYGAGDNAGNPPPILFLDGYGDQYFKHVPCVLTSFQHVMGADVDYLEIPNLGSTQYYPITQTGGQKESSASPKTTRVPTYSQIQISLQPVYSRQSLAKFDLEKFAQGRLLDKGFI
jgi:hypothetical protein